MPKRYFRIRATNWGIPLARTASPDNRVQSRQMEMLTDCYKYWPELILKYGIAYYAITGAILSFYFVRRLDIPLLRFSLVLPIAVGIGLALFAFYSASQIDFRDKQFKLVTPRRKLEVSPQAIFVKRLLIGSGLFACIVVAGLATLLFIPSWVR